MLLFECRKDEPTTNQKNKMKTISTTATVLDAQGYITAQDATVVDHGDTISINGAEHLKSDLTITGEKIGSTHGWEVLLTA